MRTFYLIEAVITGGFWNGSEFRGYVFAKRFGSRSVAEQTIRESINAPCKITKIYSK